MSSKAKISLPYTWFRIIFVIESNTKYYTSKKWYSNCHTQSSEALILFLNIPTTSRIVLVVYVTTEWILKSFQN